MKLAILTSLAGLAVAAAVSSPAIDEPDTFVYSVPPKSYQGQDAMEFWSELSVSKTHQPFAIADDKTNIQLSSFDNNPSERGELHAGADQARTYHRAVQGRLQHGEGREQRLQPRQVPTKLREHGPQRQVGELPGLLLELRRGQPPRSLPRVLRRGQLPALRGRLELRRVPKLLPQRRAKLMLPRRRSARQVRQELRPPPRAGMRRAARAEVPG